MATIRINSELINLNGRMTHVEVLLDEILKLLHDQKPATNVCSHNAEEATKRFYAALEATQFDYPQTKESDR